jgi:hypothetical protein
MEIIKRFSKEGVRIELGVVVRKKKEEGQAWYMPITSGCEDLGDHSLRSSQAKKMPSA